MATYSAKNLKVTAHKIVKRESDADEFVFVTLHSGPRKSIDLSKVSRSPEVGDYLITTHGGFIVMHEMDFRKLYSL